MSCFGDILYKYDIFDTSLDTTTSRFCDLDSENVVISTNINMIGVYAKSTLHSDLSWSFPSKEPLLSPIAVHNDVEHNYFVSIQKDNEKSVARKWRFSDTKKQSFDRQTFNSKIVALIGFKSGAHVVVEPIVVFEHGLSQLISYAVLSKRDTNKRRIIENDECIQYVDAFIDNNHQHLIVFLITKSLETSSALNSKLFSNIKSVYKLTLNPENSEIISVERQSVINNYKHWCLSTKLSSIVTVAQNCDNDQIFDIYSLNGKTEKLLFKINTNIINCYGIAMTRSGNICIIGKCSDQYVVELFELNYGTKVGDISIPHEPLLNDCKVIDNTIYITCNKGIVTIPIIHENICLAKIIAKVNHSNTKQTDIYNGLFIEFENANEDQFDYINDRISQILEPINGYINEEISIALLKICAEKLLLNSDSLKLRDIFKTIIMKPFNEVIMISKLKSLPLSFEQILMILRLLADMLPTNNEIIIDWICVLLDAHINQFIINPNESAINVLTSINNKIEYYSVFYEKIGELNVFFDSLKLNYNNIKRTNLPHHKKIQYSIELLKF